MMCFWKIFLLIFILNIACAQIPFVCSSNSSLQTKTCCPDKCGGVDKGECVDVSDSRICNTGYPSTDDSRVNWPIHFFEKVCKCKGNYAGFDCSECKFGYDESNNCESKKTIRERRSINADDFDWEDYNNKINQAKSIPSRYVVMTRGNEVHNISVYDMFVWMHHFVAKTNSEKYSRHSSGNMLLTKYR